MSASTEARRLVTQIVSASRDLRAGEYTEGWQRERESKVASVLNAQSALIAYAVRRGAGRTEARMNAAALAASGPLYDTGGPIPGVLDWLANLEAKAAA